MTEEEQKAIERLKTIDENTQEYDGHLFKKDFDTVLNLIQKQQAELEKKDKVIDEIQKEIREHIGFKNRLKRDKREPDLFNQGRFYVADNINNILKGSRR